MRKKAILSFIFFLAAAEARAEVHPRMANYFTQKINQVNSVMARETAQAPSGGIWILHDINFDLAPSVTFGVSDVLGITVAPEIDFVLTLEE